MFKPIEVFSGWSSAAELDDLRVPLRYRHLIILRADSRSVRFCPYKGLAKQARFVTSDIAQ
jgi:hypothetical protein